MIDSPVARSEVGGRFVRENDRRAVDQSASYRDPLALPSGELVRALLAMRAETSQLNKLRNTMEIPARRRVEQAGVFDILVDVQHRHQIKGLEDEANLLVPDQGNLPLRYRPEILAE